MKNVLLLIIDPQNDFTNPHGAYAGRHGIEQITEAIAKINMVIGTKLVQNHAIVYADYKPDQFEKGLLIGIPNTFGHLINANLLVDEQFIRFAKNEHSCFSSTNFKHFLKNKGFHLILACGFLAEYCVAQTGLDALNEGYKMTLIGDCIGTGDDVQYRKAAMFANMRKAGADIIDSADLSSYLSNLH